MNKNIERLTKLLNHWINHNDSHKESYEKWKNIAKDEELLSVAECIDKAIEMLDKSNNYLQEAINKIAL